MNNIHIIVLLGLMIIYWIYLLIKYEKDKKYSIEYIKENELMEKYNPLIAGCIQGNRDPLARDIMAVILNLIEKRCIKYEYLKIGEVYEHFVMKNKINENKMDPIEKYIYDWFFRNQPEKVSLFTRLNVMPVSQYYKENIERIKKMQRTTLNEIGANVASVPKKTRIFNTIISIIFSIISIINIFNIAEPKNYSENQKIAITCIIILIVIFSCVGLMSLIVILFRIVVNKMMKSISKISDKKVVSTSITGFAIFMISAVITCFMFESTQIIFNELLITMCFILVATDNLMLKNSPKMIEDFSRLNSLKERLESDTFLSEKNVEDVVLWGRYLAYAISFGVSEKAIKKLCDDADFKVENIQIFLDGLTYLAKKTFSYAYSEGMPNSDDHIIKYGEGTDRFF